MSCIIVSQKSLPPPQPAPFLTIPHPGALRMCRHCSCHQRCCIGHIGTNSLTGLIRRRRAATMVRVVTYMMWRGRAGEIFCRFSLIRHYDTRHRKIACNHMRSRAIPWGCMGSHDIACDFVKSHFSANLMSMTVRVFENTLGTRSGNEHLPKVFLHNNWTDLL